MLTDCADISVSSQPGAVVFADSLGASLAAILRHLDHDHLALVTDNNVAPLADKLLSGSSSALSAPRVVIPAGEENKDIKTLEEVWQGFEAASLTRRSIVINLGGGVVTDLGGFAAACYKRGIRFINLPTTLLAAADASVGGKTGIDFCGLKNEIGVFALPQATIVSTSPFATLPDREFYSGYAEIVKMGYVADFSRVGAMLDIDRIKNDPAALKEVLSFAIEAKQAIVDADPKEQGLRRVLNFGHTAGHAFESLLLSRGKGITHGCAVAHGILVALILGHVICGMPSAPISPYVSFLRENYPRLPIGCKDYPELITLMHNDKKNRGKGVSFVLLNEGMHPLESIAVSDGQLTDALDLYRDC